MGPRLFILLALLAGTARAAPDNEPTSRAIAGALKFLGENQRADGAWTLRNGGSPVGMTSYAVLAYLAASDSPQGGAYAANVARGITFLSDSVGPDGAIYREAFGQFPHNLYDQGSATFALAEACVTSGDEALRPKVARAAAFIASCQDRSGGWKFKPVAAERPDLPVTALQLAALRAARDAEVQVPQTVIDRGADFLLSCRDEKTGGFAYTPRGSNPGPSRTASAVWALQLCGRGDLPAVAEGSQYLFHEPTPAQRDEQGLWFAYGRYYAAAAQRLRGRETWDRWYPAVRAELLRSAHRDRDRIWWEDPTSNPPDPVYITALNATILALPLNHVPLYTAENSRKS
jgi:prenyltransferase/squalene oxidase-like repeat protein